LEVKMSGEFWQSDDQWSRLQPMLPNKPRGVPRVDDRKVISGIVHVLQSGCRWKDAPAIYGPSKTLYNRNVRWAAKGAGVLCSRRWPQKVARLPRF
jgi:transposase